MSGAMAAGDNGVPAFPARDIPGSGDLRTNGWLAILLVALVAVIPLPLGGNRPAVVAAAGCYVFAVGAWYAMRLGGRRHALRIGLARLWLPALLGAGLVVYVVIQTLRLGRSYG
jgi:hypothetical protein